MLVTRRVRVSSKGQLVIPKDMRETLGLQPGDELVLHLLSDRIILAEAPEPSRLERALARVQAEVQERGITREDVAEALKEARSEVYRERQEAGAGR